MARSVNFIEMVECGGKGIGDVEGGDGLCRLTLEGTRSVKKLSCNRQYDYEGGRFQVGTLN